MALCNHLKFIPLRLKLLFELNFVGVYFSARASCWCCLTRKTSHQNKLLSLSSAFPGWRWAGQAWSLKLYSSPLTSDLYSLTSQPRGQSADSGPDQRRCVSRIITSLLIKLLRISRFKLLSFLEHPCDISLAWTWYRLTGQTTSALMSWLWINWRYITTFELWSEDQVLMRQHQQVLIGRKKDLSTIQLELNLPTGPPRQRLHGSHQ